MVRQQVDGAVGTLADVAETGLRLGEEALLADDAVFFHHEPGDVCRFCDFNELCDVRRVPISKRKVADDRRASFEEMKQVT